MTATESAKKKLLLALACAPAALLLAAEVYAAPSKPAPATSSLPIYSWTGCYAGPNLGWGWGRQNLTDTFGTSVGPTTLSGGLDSSGGLFGAQAGCDYQLSGPWVVGMQGEFSGSTIAGRASDPGNGFTEFLSTPGTVGIRANWLASITGRVGVTALDGQTLFYAKAGPAWVRDKWDLSQSSLAQSGTVTAGLPTLDESRLGWTLAAGVEHALSQNWSIFAEFNYYSFGQGTSLTIPMPPAPSYGYQTGHQQIEAVEIGANYKIRGP